MRVAKHGDSRGQDAAASRAAEIAEPVGVPSPFCTPRRSPPMIDCAAIGDRRLAPVVRHAVQTVTQAVIRQRRLPRYPDRASPNEGMGAR
jgi:hypothetical protein